MVKELSALEKESYKKRIMVSVFTIISIAVCLIITFKPVYALSVDDILDTYDELFGPKALAYPFSKFSSYLMSGVFVNEMVAKFYTPSVMDTIVTGITGESESFMTAFTASLKAIGIFVICFQTIMSLMKELSHAQLTAESALRIGLTFCIPAAFILEYDTFLHATAAVGMYFHGLLNSSISGSFDDIAVGVSKGVKLPKFTINFMKVLKGLVKYWVALTKTLPILLTQLIINYLIIITIMSGVMSNYVEIGLRHIFMPLAIANIAHDGIRSAGFRYVKRYLGCFIKIAAITAAVELSFYVYNQLLESSLHLMEQWLFFLLLFPLVKQAIKMCNEIVTEAMGE